MRTYSAFRFLLPLLAIAATRSPAIAQAQSEPEDTVPRYQLEEVTVTTARVTDDRTRIPQKIEVVTAEDIDRTPGSTVAEVLRRTTPLDVIEYPGLLAGLSIRGFRPQYSGTNPRTLILLDGRPAGTVNPALLNVTNVERIEILRGPASALYGSSAMGGVVNLITRRSSEELAGAVRGSLGSFGEYDVDVRSGGTLTDRVDFDLALAFAGRTEGYATGSNRTFAADSLVKTLPDGTTTQLPWVTADTALAYSRYQTSTASGRLGYLLSQQWRLDLTGEIYEGDDVENPGDLNVVDWDPRSLKDLARRSFDLRLGEVPGAGSAAGRVYAVDETVDYFNAPDPGPDTPQYVSFRTPVTTYGAQLQDVIDFGRGDLTFGADYMAVEASSRAFTEPGVAGAPYSPDSGVHSLAAFAQARLSVFRERLVLSGGGRLDRVGFHVRETPNLAGYAANSERHLVLTPNLGARYTVLDGFQVYGNFGRAFVTPDAFNVAGYAEQRAGQGSRSVLITRGNPELRPETSTSWDAGITVRRPGAGLDLDLTYFTTSIHDRITTERSPADGPALTPAGDTIVATTTYVNAHEGEISGVEASMSYDFLGAGPTAIRFFANGTTFLHARERLRAGQTDDEGESVRRIRNVADVTLLAGVDLDDGRRFGGRLTARYVGERVDDDYLAWWAPGEIRYPEYLVLDLSTRVRLHERYQLGLELRNLADEDYFEVRGYNLPGRSLRVSAEIDF